MKLEPGATAVPGYDKEFISKMMSGNFAAMDANGDRIMRPFLQDVPSFEVLGRTLGTYMLQAPLMVPSLVAAVGVGNLAEWAKHYATMGAYTLATKVRPRRCAYAVAASPFAMRPTLASVRASAQLPDTSARARPARRWSAHLLAVHGRFAGLDGLARRATASAAGVRAAARLRRGAFRQRHGLRVERRARDC